MAWRWDWQQQPSAWHQSMDWQQDWHATDWHATDWQQGSSWGGSSSWEWPDDKKDPPKPEKKLVFSGYSFLGGAKKGSLPLSQQAILLKSTLTEVPQLCLQSWKSITSLCAFWILFRVDASATSMASLGSELTEITGHLEEAFKNSYPTDADRATVIDWFKRHGQDQGKILERAVGEGFVAEPDRHRSDYRGDASRNSLPPTAPDGRVRKRRSTSEEIQRFERRKRLAEVTLEAAEAELRAQRMEAAVRGEGAAEAPKKPHLLHSPAIPNSWVAQTPSPQPIMPPSQGGWRSCAFIF
ncbi:unnamed protein product [Cladocopium goreaui]|uniref:Uncharacterized protein n=1 Tax=Cladocopium goreaui TaxID=2562237 RepID=A0A9P1GJT9_9DINO|nr:unnamed protein product [Cladocopium goreaui]